MGRPWVRGRRGSSARGPSGSMRLAFYCCFACVWTATLAAADIDIYPDEVILKRIQKVLTELREKQLRVLQFGREHQPEPPFTYHFPESSQSYQNGLFAVPPSDPRYYQPEADLSVQETKRVEDEYKRVDEPVRSQGLTPEPPQEKEVWSDEVPSETSDSTEMPDDDMSFVLKKTLSQDNRDIILVAVVAACGAAAAAGVVALSYGWYKLRSNSKAAADIEYPAYGVTGPNKEISPTGDRRLAQSAQMYHYQHQKQQIIAMESNRASNERRGSVSEGDSDEENEEGDYTVYECPGLAATGELEVKNPLFLDDPTPATANHNAEKPSTPADLK